MVVLSFLIFNVISLGGRWDQLVLLRVDKDCHIHTASNAFQPYKGKKIQAEEYVLFY